MELQVLVEEANKNTHNTKKMRYSREISIWQDAKTKGEEQKQNWLLKPQQIRRIGPIEQQVQLTFCDEHVT